MKSLFRFLFSVRTIVLTLLVLAVVGGGLYLWLANANAGGTSFRTEPVKRGNLSATITATGTVEPEEVIDVGAQVAGLILNFGSANSVSIPGLGSSSVGLAGAPLGQGAFLAVPQLITQTPDPLKPATPPVDYCTPVSKGQILAWIDPTLYQTRLEQSKSALLAAKSALAQAEANVAGARVNRDALKATYESDANAPLAVAHQQLITEQAAYVASDMSYKAQLAFQNQAEFNVKTAEAGYSEAMTNLDYCTIASPVDGVIVDRRVNVGQTVVASLSAPSLFLLAKDLTKMQVWASVNEADIGNIHIGQDVTFTVDARPGKTFHGKVSQVRLNASMTQNVVTYTVVVSTTNKLINVPAQGHGKPSSPDTTNTAPAQELELLPYLTANLTFHVADRQDVVQVPNAALRWRPQPEKVDPKYAEEYKESMHSKKTPKEPSGDDATAAPAATPGSPDGGSARQHGGASSQGMVWVQEDNGFVRPIKIVTGLTDGAMTEVVRVIKDDNLHKDDALDEGAPAPNERAATMLVTGENTGKAAGGTTNPFAPPPIFRPQQPKKDDQQK